jgi:NADH:ubiquinone oxidoreductase subunit F (NADH-binding)
MGPPTASLPRLLLGVGERPTADLAEHLDLHGPLPDDRRADPRRLIDSIERSGLRGHGGAAFPAARKLRAVSERRRRPIVLANGTEGEPASKKDRVLLRDLPHLVLDGAVVAARVTGAREVVIAVCESDDAAFRAVEEALRQRSASRLRGEPVFHLIPTPSLYIAGQETALVNYVNTGIPRPTFGPRPFERGVSKRPTLVQNVETLAHIALIARHGAGWFMELGTPEDPGTALVTISGAVERPGVYEIEHGMDLAELLRIAGAADALAAVLLGGYFGSWVSADDVDRLQLSRAHLAPLGASLGAGVVVALGRGACPVAETARVAEWFDAQGARQCGPCVHGLGAIADSLQRVATGTAPPSVMSDLARWTAELPGRGACAHPDGAVRFIASAMQVFAPEFRAHFENGPCMRCAQPAVLPTPGARPDYALAA